MKTQLMVVVTLDSGQSVQISVPQAFVLQKQLADALKPIPAPTVIEPAPVDESDPNLIRFQNWVGTTDDLVRAALEESSVVRDDNYAPAIVERPQAATPLADL